MTAEKGSDLRQIAALEAAVVVKEGSVENGTLDSAVQKTPLAAAVAVALTARVGRALARTPSLIATGAARSLQDKTGCSCTAREEEEEDAVIDFRKEKIVSEERIDTCRR